MNLVSCELSTVDIHVYILMGGSQVKKPYHYATLQFTYTDMMSSGLGGWMDELGFYVSSTVFQSFRDDEG